MLLCLVVLSFCTIGWFRWQAAGRQAGGDECAAPGVWVMLWLFGLLALFSNAAIGLGSEHCRVVEMTVPC